VTSPNVRQHVTTPERFAKLVPVTFSLVSNVKALQRSAAGGRFDTVKMPTTGTVRWQVIQYIT